MSNMPCTCGQTQGAYCPDHGYDAAVPPAGAAPEVADQIRQLEREQQSPGGTR